MHALGAFTIQSDAGDAIHCDYSVELTPCILIASQLSKEEKQQQAVILEIFGKYFWLAISSK